MSTSITGNPLQPLQLLRLLKRTKLTIDTLKPIRNHTSKPLNSPFEAVHSRFEPVNLIAQVVLVLMRIHGLFMDLAGFLTNLRQHRPVILPMRLSFPLTPPRQRTNTSSGDRIKQVRYETHPR